MKILFRTSGGSNPKNELGMGHIYRCINLAKKIKTHDTLFLIEDFGSVTKLLKNNGQKVMKLDPGIDEKADIKETQRCIEKNKVDILVIDKYGLKNNFVKSLRKKIKTVVITDLYKNNYDADLIINGFIGYNNSIEYNKYKTKCLLGPRFQILNNYSRLKISRKKEFDLVITLGGYDSKCIIEKILEYIIKNYNFKTLVILGPATKETAKILEIGKQQKKNIKIIKETKNFGNEISKGKYAITGGGISTYEFARLRIPFGIICQYNHQLITSKEWDRKGIGKNLGVFNIKLNNKIKLFLEKINQDNIKIRTSKKIKFSDTEKILDEILRLKYD